jgi:hypothetical protein
VFKGKKMAGHMGASPRDHAEPQDRLAPMSERGLIMIKGAVPGAKGGWILVRDASRRRCRTRRCRVLPAAAGVRSGCGCREGGSRMMDIKVTTLEGKAAGSITVSDEIFGLEPRTDLIHRVVRWQLAKKPGRARTRPRAVRRFPARRRCSSPEGHRRRASRQQALRSSAAAARLTVRSFAATPRSSQEGSRARPASRAVGQGKGRHHRRRHA